MRFLGVLAASLMVWMGVGTPLVAQDTTLTAKKGDLTLVGKLVDFDGEFYQIQTLEGLLTVDARAVTCVGPDCPAASAFVSTFEITVQNDSQRNLALSLIEGFAALQEAEVALTLSADATQTATVTGQNNSVLANISLTRLSAKNRNAEPKNDTTIAMTDTPSKSAENVEHIGLDALVVLVAQSTLLNSISLVSLRDVLSGKISNWKNLGGADVPIEVHFSQAQGAFAKVMAKMRLSITAKGSVRHATFSDLADGISASPYAIGVGRMSDLRNAKQLALRGSCGILSTPSAFGVKAGAYDVAYAVSFQKRAGARLPIFAREFLEFVQSGPAASIANSVGYVGANLSRRGIADQGQRLADSLAQAEDDVALEDLKAMAAMMSGADQLSPTFRFKPSSTKLNTASQQAAADLAAGLIAGNYADKIVYLAGFTDGVGPADKNKTLSEKRAEVVRQAVVAAAPDGSLSDVDFRTVGFGETSPIACDSDTGGPHVNRRVEVWIKDRN